MSICTVSVAAGYTTDNTQKRIHLYGQLVISGTVYPAGGIPLDSVLLALPGITTNAGVKFFQAQSEFGSGYIYQRVRPSATSDTGGVLMILQVPPNGSLTTAAPLQQVPSSINTQGIVNDYINFHCTFNRNSI